MNAHILMHALFGRPDDNAGHDPICLGSTGMSGRADSGALRLHSRVDLHQLIWLEEGFVEVMLQGGMTRLPAPAVISVPPPVQGVEFGGEPRGVSLALSHDCLDRITLQLEGAALMVKHRVYAIGGHVLGKHENGIAEIFSRIVLECRKDHLHRRPALFANATLLVVEMARLLNLQNQSGDQALPLKSRVVFRNFKALIEAHFRDHWKISEYAAALSTNERSLRRICRALSGFTPAEILQQRIILEAKRGLSFTDKTVSEICYGLGFADPAHFTKYFVNNLGVSPTAYRAQRLIHFYG